MSTFLLSVTVALLPLLVPRGPGNTAPADLFAAAFIVLALLALAQRGRRLKVPAGPALALILAGSLIATALSADPRTALFTLLVDAYLILLFITVANHLDRDPETLRTVLLVWTGAALVWASVLIGTHWQLLPKVLAQLLNINEDAKRAAGSTGDNPNLAASYLMTSYFVLLASPWPKRRLIRWLAAAWLLFGLFATGSLGGLLGLISGVVFFAIGVYLRGGRTPGQVQALVGAALLAGSLAATALLVVAGLPRFNLADVNAISEQAQTGVLNESVGRASRSLTGRLGLWSAAVAKTGPRAAAGIGPGTAKEELQISGRSPSPDGTIKVHSLHNDFLAFLIERGVLGLAGLLALYAVLLWRSLHTTADGPPSVGMAALGAAVVANAADSLFHETWHFRHVIVLFALAWIAADLARRPRPAAPRTPLKRLEELHAAR
jgi:O-antigen ligase